MKLTSLQLLLSGRSITKKKGSDVKPSCRALDPNLVLGRLGFRAPDSIPGYQEVIADAGRYQVVRMWTFSDVYLSLTSDRHAREK